MSRLGVGVLGAADIAWRSTVPSFAADPGFRIAAVASRSPARAARFGAKFGCATPKSYDDLLQRSDVDVVYVPLPTGLHAEWAAKALEAGKHVLLEKSLTATYPDAVRLTDLARRHRLVLMENFMFLRHSQHAYVRKLLDDGVIGELRSLQARFAIPARPPGDIRYRPELGGGALLDTGAYTVRAAQLFLGPDITVCGSALRYGDEGVDLGGAALLVDGAGVTAELGFGLADAYACSYVLLGTAGRIVLDRAFTCPPTHRPRVLVDRPDHHEELTLDAADHFAATVADFGAAVGGVTAGAVAERTTELLVQARLLAEIRSRAVPSPRRRNAP